jgi:hypothetical protein
MGALRRAQLPRNPDEERRGIQRTGLSRRPPILQDFRALSYPRRDPLGHASKERAEDLLERRGALLGPLGAAEAQRAVREAWRRNEAPVLERRMAALELEIARQVEQRAQSVERERPAYLAQALGPRPEHDCPRERWRAPVRTLEGYRARHGIRAPSGPWAPRPPSPPTARSTVGPGRLSRTPAGRSSGPTPGTARLSAFGARLASEERRGTLGG